VQIESGNTPPVITVGSGNVEYILRSKGELELGKKHLINSQGLIGGSCVNYALRLLTVGCSVFPVPLVGDDRCGQKIRGRILDAAIQKGITARERQFIESDDFFVPGAKTPRTTVIVHGEQRTIFSEVFAGSRETEKHFQKRFQLLNQLLPENSGSVMIGHITLDSDSRKPGLITRMVIDAFYDRFLMFANFGNCQIQHGIDFWQEDLKRIDLLQLNFDEIKKMFRCGNQFNSLYEIIAWLRNHSITAVITLSKFGAIGTYEDGEDGIILAWPLDIGEIVDPTGAGDAFAAGMITSLRGQKDFTFQHFLSAIERGRLWASYACTTIGACSNCPDRDTLDDYIRRNSRLSNKYLEITDSINSEPIMNLIERAY
jgi:sugar/nucleoside kinase (ribokinase family)